ncbi:MAG: hypothetical protein JO051_10160 [Acidobacteriaceae bacterium]|nr:hypothetical protein [Acidobacteriaceae bacterium]
MAVDTRIPVYLDGMHYRLARNAPAMQITPDGSGKLRLGTLIRLPDGAEVEVCGEGFDDCTAKVVWHGSSYYVFRDDLQSSLQALAAACAG